MQQLGAGTRKVVMFPDGQGMPAQPPPGLALATGLIWFDAAGQPHRNQYLFRPDLTDRGAIRKAEKTNTLPELLGGPEGMGAPDKSALQGPPIAVLAKGPDGPEAQTTATHAAIREGGTIKIPDQILAGVQGLSPTPEQNRQSSIADPLTLKDQEMQDFIPPPDQTASGLCPNKRKQKRSVPNWIHWLLVLPFAIVGAMLAGVVSRMMIEYIPFSDWDAFHPYIASVLGNWACPATFVYAGTSIAPSAKRTVAITLGTIFMGLITAGAIFDLYLPGYRFVAVIVSAVSVSCGVAEVFREAREKQPIEYHDPA
jgi:hypothetical protein